MMPPFFPFRSLARPLLPFLLGLSLLLAAGCSPKLVPTGTLDSYDSFNLVDRRDVKMRTGLDREALETFFNERGIAPPSDTSASTTQKKNSAVSTASPDSTSTRSLVFVIQPVKWAAGAVYTGENREALLGTARESLLYWTGRNYPYPVIYRYGLLPNDPLLYRADVVFIESILTDVRKGFAPVRHPILSWLNLGAVSVQLEGCLHHGTPSGPVLAEFAVRSRTNGAPGGGDSGVEAFFNGFFWGLGVYPKMYSNLYCIKFALNETGFKLLPRIKDFIPPPPSASTEPSNDS